MPAMMTTDEQIVRQDCLCYLMERVNPGGEISSAENFQTELPEIQP